MVIATDFSIAANGDIRYTGTNDNHTVLAFHRWLQDLADDAFPTAPLSDKLAIPDLTPSERSTDNIITLINGYNITATEAIHLYDGSITQDSGATVYAGLVVVGAVETGTAVIIIQDNALLTDTWTTFPNADPANNIILRAMVNTRLNDVDIDQRRIIVEAREYGDTYGEFSVQLNLGNNVAALFTSVDGNNQTASGTVGAYDKLDNTEGYQLLDMTAVGSQEPFYSQWQLTGTGTLPASPVINDLYEYAKYIQRIGTAETIHGVNGSLFRGITHEWLYDGIVGAEPATNEDYAWGAFLDGTHTGTFTLGEVVTGGTSGAVGRVISIDETNDSLVVDTESGTWTVGGETITGTTSAASTVTVGPAVGQATGGGTAIILAADTTGNEVWVQLTRGTAPSDDAIIYEDVSHIRVIAVFGAVGARTISAPFIGTSTGTALNPGAFGIGMDVTDTTASDLFVDLGGINRQPPNNVTFTVSGLVAGDRVLVGPESGGALLKTQFTLGTSLIADNITAVVIDQTIPSDTPAAGTIRVTDNKGVDRRLEYSGWTGSTFTISSTDGQEDFFSDEATAANAVYISYIDIEAVGTTVAFTSVYNVNRPLFVRAREGTSGTPIKTFETTGTLGSAGGSATANRISDA